MFGKRINILTFSGIKIGIDVGEYEAYTEKNSTMGPSGCVSSTRRAPEAMSGW